tara:strand:+ start:878 stop:2335 length:1458 start_codon:yes stop_codon:yes gene_type:complete
VSQNKVTKKIINWELVAVNPTNKNWDWKDLFCFWGVNIQSIIGFSLIASLYTIYNLNSFIVFFGSILGSILIYFFSNLIGKPSQKYGLPFATILRASLGYSGARVFGFLRSLVGIFLFGIQTYFLSKAIGYLVRILFFTIDSSILDKDIFLTFLLGLNVIDWSSLVTCIIIQIYIFSRGMLFNRKIINFSAITVYSGLIIFFLMILLSDVKLTSKAFIEILNFENFLNYDNIFPILTVAGTVFAYFSIIIISLGDFTRYIKNERNLKNGNLTLLFNLILFSVFAVFIVAGSDVFLNQKFEDLERIFTNPTDIVGKYNNLQITVIALFFIVLASASTNLIANFIPSQYALINFQPNRLNIRNVSFIIGIFGLIIGIFWQIFLSQIGILTYIDTFSCFFGPLSGVMIVNYYIVNKSKIDVKDIHSLSSGNVFYFSKGWHLKAIYSVIIGFIFASSTIWNSNLMFLQSYAWIIGTIASGFVYYLLDKR